MPEPPEARIAELATVAAVVVAVSVALSSPRTTSTAPYRLERAESVAHVASTPQTGPQDRPGDSR